MFVLLKEDTETETKRYQAKKLDALSTDLNLLDIVVKPQQEIVRTQINSTNLTTSKKRIRWKDDLDKSKNPKDFMRN